MRYQHKKRKSLSSYLGAAISLLVISLILSHAVIAQCSLIDNSRDALFISYERDAKIKSDDGGTVDGVLLRLHNNSTCEVLITAGSAEKFVKPLPKNPTILQMIKREVEYELPDGVLVPEVLYRYNTSRESGHSVGGDNFYGFSLLGKRSVLFEAPLKHFDLNLTSKITLSFNYAWEKERRARTNYPSVENTVQFSSEELPNAVKQKIRK